MAAELRVPVLEKTGKYLGIPSDWGQTKKDMFAWILARVDMKLESWKEKFLSTAGKEILIKTVVQALPQYAMSIFKVPLSVCRAIEKKIANFWWKTTSSKKGTHWRRWELLKQRKETGGLGFKDLIAFNKAMLGKQTWRLAENPTALWSKLFKGLYFPNGNIWNAKPGSRPSWGWQSILMGREDIKKNVRWAVCTRDKIRIREDCWLPSGLIGGPPNRDDPTMVMEIIDHTTHCWDSQQINTMFTDNVAAEILSTPICPRLEMDMLIWTGNAQGKYSVKSGYYSIFNSAQQANTNGASSSYQPPASLWKTIWQLSTPPK